MAWTDITKPTTATPVSKADYGDPVVDNLDYLYTLAKNIEIEAFAQDTDVAVGNGAKFIHIPPSLNGANITYVHAFVVTAGTTNTTNVQITRIRGVNTDAVLSTVLSIDSGETGSDTAEAAAVIDTANDDLATNDILRIDITQVSTTPPKGLVVTIGASMP